MVIFKKIKLHQLLGGCIALALFGAVLWPGSIFTPDFLIRLSLLRQTPLGSTTAEVTAILIEKGWYNPKYLGTTGFLDQRGGTFRTIIGATSVSGNIGDLGPMNLTAFWGFNEDGKLIDVSVWRTFDGP
jgi:hypothetical protein